MANGILMLATCLPIYPPICQSKLSDIVFLLQVMLFMSKRRQNKTKQKTCLSKKKQQRKKSRF